MRGALTTAVDHRGETLGASRCGLTATSDKKMVNKPADSLKWFKEKVSSLWCEALNFSGPRRNGQTHTPRADELE